MVGWQRTTQGAGWRTGAKQPARVAGIRCYNNHMIVTTLLQQADATALLSAKLILAIVCVIVASSLALGVCVGLMRRIQTIAGPERTPQTRPDVPARETDQPDH